MASIAKRNGNQCTYSGNGGLLSWTGLTKGLRLEFKKYVHLLNSTSNSYQKTMEKANRGDKE